MGYTNDCANRNKVLIVFVLFYLYLSFISNELKRSKNWSGVNCNPLAMVIGSIFSAEDSNSQFQKCMQYSVSNDNEERIKQYSSTIDAELQSNINKLSAGTSNTENATDYLLKDTANEINNMQNESLDNETTINNLKIKVQQMTDKINTSFNTLRQSSNTTDTPDSVSNLLTKLDL